MVTLTLTRLIKTLSGPEKRAFKLATRKQQGKKDYVDLFTIIEKNSDAGVAVVQEQFRKLHPTTSINNTARYLLMFLTDSLVESKRQKDNFFHLLQGIMRVRVLRERSLSEEAADLLKEIRESASQSQQHLVEYFTHREELDYAAEENFHQLDDTGLITAQMRSKDILRSLNNIHDHHSLFELMKYRLLNSGTVVSDDDKKRLNDLMLSEMILVAGKSKNSFASQKLHLLFQSYFFTDTGDYLSALKTFRLLSTLFEQNLKLLSNPPLDYLSVIDGILENLNSLGKYDEMMYYIEKLDLFDNARYPEYFRYQAKKMAIIYRLAISAGQQDAGAAIQIVSGTHNDILELYSAVNEEKQWQIYFYCSLAYFLSNQWRKAHSFIKTVMQQHKGQSQLNICKAVRLLNILIYYEQGDADYLEYEIRSYKRFIKKDHSMLKTESLVLKYLLQWPDVKRKKISNAQYEYFIAQVTSVSSDKYERQLLKYFDFAGWLQAKLERQHT